MLACLIPAAGEESSPITFTPAIEKDCEYDIHEVADLLSTAYMISPDAAQKLGVAFGDEQTLLSWLHSQTPWLATPVIEPDGRHGRTVAADWFLVAEKYQPDPHDTVCNICETLLALSPKSKAADSEAVDSFGHPIAVGDFKPYSKSIPRGNLPAKSRVAWNVAFRQIMLAKTAWDSLTDYTQQMAELVRRTEKVVRMYSEKLVRGIRISNAEKIIGEINEIVKQINSLAYAKPEMPSSSMTHPAATAGEYDNLGAFLTGVLNNLVPRMIKLPTNSGEKSIAAFAGALAVQALDHSESSIWRTHLSPPASELKALADRLIDISSIMHEMAYDNSQKKKTAIFKAAKKWGVGKAVRSAARYCRTAAQQRLQKNYVT
ncbi:MAG: hypothetical protein D3924_04215 [Candidatus Electrothrix sp. AR4]|nr:hypothetical protein [Candidatus Electrothrix sp. AR4]